MSRGKEKLPSRGSQSSCSLQTQWLVLLSQTTGTQMTAAVTDGQAGTQCEFLQLLGNAA
jgi:hypothetical protein